MVLVRALIAGLLGFVVLNRTVCRADHYLVFDEVFHFFLLAFALIVYLVIVFLDWRQFSKNGNWRSCIPTLVGTLAIFSIIVTQHILTLRDRSPTVLFASSPADFNGVSLDLRADSTYKITSWSIGADIYRGKYQIRDSTIILERTGDEGLNSIRANLLAIHWRDSEITEIDSASAYVRDRFLIRRVN